MQERLLFDLLFAAEDVLSEVAEVIIPSAIKIAESSPEFQIMPEVWE
jgi:hypothetical protein